MKIDCTSNSGRPCLNCEAYVAGYEAGTGLAGEDPDTLLLKLEAMHRRAQKAEGELAKIGGEPGGLAYLRAAKDWAAHWQCRAENAEARLTKARADEETLRRALRGDAACESLRLMRRRAQKAESAIRAVERRAEGVCRDAERRVTEQHRIRALYRKEMRDAADMIRASGLVSTDTPANPETGAPRIVQGRLDVLVPALIAECERLRAEVARLREASGGR